MHRSTENRTRRGSADIERFSEKTSCDAVVGHHYVTLLGLRTFDTPGLLKQVRQGLSYSTWERFVRNTALPKHAAATLVQISSRTLNRRKEEGRFHPDESDRLLRATRIFAETLALFEGDAVQARRWLTSPQPALGNSTPLDYASTGIGAREVENLIGRLEHGIPG